MSARTIGCKTCKHFACEVVMGNGMPMEKVGRCMCPGKFVKTVEDDDCCNFWNEAEWHKSEKTVP